jgi:long-chain fatty acid transport protein
VLQPNGAPALLGSGLPGTTGVVTIPFQYSDGWFYSVGAEYQWNEKLALRSGVGYEKSPITDQVRIPLLSDNDRTWLSVGASYKYSSKMTFDFAYSHVFVKSTPINIVPGNPSYSALAGTYTGTVDSQIDIVSVAMHYRWDEPAAEPAPKSKLYHK